MSELEQHIYQLRCDIVRLKQYLEQQPTVSGFLAQLAQQPAYKTGYSVYDEGYRHGQDSTTKQLREYFSVPD